MKRIFALILSFALLLSCLVLPAGAMFDPSPVYQVPARTPQPTAHRNLMGTKMKL